MKGLAITCVAALCSILLIGTSAHADDLAIAKIMGVPADYAGLPSSSDGGFALCHVNQIMEGVKAFYALHGAWPASWSQVREDGLVTVPLRTPNGMVIDPDDGQIDGDFDALYSPKADGSDPDCVFVQLSVQAAPIKIKMTEPLTDHELLLRLDNVFGQRFPSFAVWEQNPAQLKRLALVRLNNALLVTYEGTRAAQLGSWQEFVESGWASVSDSAVNPLTNRTWRGDGSPNDLAWDGGKASKPEGMHQLGMVLEDGRVIELQ